MTKRCVELRRAAKKLRGWFDEEDDRLQSDMAAALSVKEATVSLWCSGDRCPSGRFPEDIETYTDGAVPAGLWPRKVAQKPVRKFVPSSPLS